MRYQKLGMKAKPQRMPSWRSSGKVLRKTKSTMRSERCMQLEARSRSSMINSSKTRLSRLNRDFEFSAYGYRFAPHTSAAVPVVQKVPNAIQYALEVPRTQADQLS